ncbi:hypothetical protein ACZ90_10065 [Streptomyces albus subsp. albus]|nr:hypothetical protein ACZ90_10065 [Streptomyces albus subsp. albus]
MGTIDTPAVSVADVKDAISRAVPATEALPRIEDLMALHTRLLKLIVVLEPLAKRRIDTMDRRTVEWYNAASRLDEIQYQVAMGLGSGLQSAARHVRTLGYTLQFLLVRSGLEDEAAQQ